MARSIIMNLDALTNRRLFWKSINPASGNVYFPMVYLESGRYHCTPGKTAFSAMAYWTFYSTHGYMDNASLEIALGGARSRDQGAVFHKLHYRLIRSPVRGTSTTPVRIHDPHRSTVGGPSDIKRLIGLDKMMSN